MDNYTLEIMDKEERKKVDGKFIKKYEIKNKGKKIVIYLANGKKVTLPYTKKIEEGVLAWMEQEVVDYKDVMKLASVKKREYDDLVWSINAGSVLLVFFAMLTGSLLCFGILSLIILIVVTIAHIWQKQYTDRYKDYEKNMLFLENKELINQKVAENSHVFVNCVSEKTQKKIVTKTDGQRGYTINSIDKMSFEELKELLDLLKMEIIASQSERFNHPNINDDVLDVEKYLEPVDYCDEVKKKTLKK